ncbi:putative ORFan [Tupanvirus deep ocean]|uniref:ORFan n=2 Tax=Tupanvirus TaxID=2094720 RepID=A0AC62A759_9VIRU|nr:putative ORFan [Tupanvirus deep ocean]QKU33620.1 putative ORFan [Tupanvirus deep ocean]
MNSRIVDMIETFCKKSQDYNLPGTIMSSIIYLNYSSNEWSQLNQSPYSTMPHYDTRRQEVSDNIQRIIVALIEKIPNHRICTDLVMIFSEIVVSYMDSVSHDEAKVDELADAFNSMMITYKTPNNFENIFSKMAI